MKKYILLFFIAISFIACQTTNSSSRVQNTQSALPQSVSENACELGQVEQCFYLGNAYYSKKDYLKAIKAYDIVCQQQYVPACLQMAVMFENGQGIPKNLENALDIYTKACYLGYDKSCNDMKRLQKRLGVTVRQ